MTASDLAPLTRGLWGVLATPFAGGELDLDADSLARESAHFAAAPATGLVVLGVFGEGLALDSGESRRAVETVAAAVPGLPLVVGVSARTTAVAREQARAVAHAAGDALAGLLVQLNSASPDVVVAHLHAVHEATGAGIVLQDYPATSGVSMDVAAQLEVVARCPFVVAVKSESPPTALAIRRLTAGTGVPVFGGLGGVGLLDELAAGAAGAMTGFSHPEALRATLDAWETGGAAAARDAFAPWLPLVNFEAQPGIGLALRKEILRRRGILAEACVRPPAPALPDELADLLAAHLDAAPDPHPVRDADPSTEPDEGTTR